MLDFLGRVIASGFWLGLFITALLIIAVAAPVAYLAKGLRWLARKCLSAASYINRRS